MNDENVNNVLMDKKSAACPITWIVLAALGIAAMIVVCGCASLSISSEDMARLDALADEWIAKIESSVTSPETIPGGTVETPTPETSPDPAPVDPAPAADQVDYSLLQWQYGGFSGAKAKLDSPRLSRLSCNGRSVIYHWDVGMSGWGLSNSEAGAICAFFVLRDGVWVGGKFDWVSVSRSSRELKHLESYKSWPSSGITLPVMGSVAFVVVSADGRRRSNVVTAEAHQ